MDYNYHINYNSYNEHLFKIDTIEINKKKHFILI